jgi:hypothetical protein
MVVEVRRPAQSCGIESDRRDVRRLHVMPRTAGIPALWLTTLGRRSRSDHCYTMVPGSRNLEAVSGFLVLYFIALQVRLPLR